MEAIREFPHTDFLIKGTLDRIRVGMSLHRPEGRKANVLQGIADAVARLLNVAVGMSETSIANGQPKKLSTSQPPSSSTILSKLLELLEALIAKEQEIRKLAWVAFYVMTTDSKDRRDPTERVPVKYGPGNSGCCWRPEFEEIMLRICVRIIRDIRPYCAPRLHIDGPPIIGDRFWTNKQARMQHLEDYLKRMCKERPQWCSKELRTLVKNRRKTNRMIREVMGRIHKALNTT